MSPEQMLAEVATRDVYEVKLDSKNYQVEVSLLENTVNYLHITVAVDDGSLPASIWPSTQTIICQKAPS